MAVVKGVKEQVHLPLYDCIEVKPERRLGETLTSNVLRFFVDVTGKTKLLTNMQAASLLPHWNTFEARALRVVISDLSPKFPDFSESLVGELRDVRVLDESFIRTNITGATLPLLIDFDRRIRSSPTGSIEVEFSDLDTYGLRSSQTAVAGGSVVITEADIKAAAVRLKQNGNGQVPSLSQLFPNNGCGNVIGNFIYNTVTTFFVGEKIMIQVPTWFFPAGAGPYSESAGTITHGYPNPQATFRFAEPVVIETQQNFRVEIEIPESEVLKDLQSLYGPLFIWVVLDGYMTRDVQ